MANDQISNQISHDLSLAESVAIPLTLVAFVFVFGSFMAALLPLAVEESASGDSGRAQVANALRAGVRHLLNLTPPSASGWPSITAFSS